MSDHAAEAIVEAILNDCLEPDRNSYDEICGDYIRPDTAQRIVTALGDAGYLTGGD